VATPEVTFTFFRHNRFELLLFVMCVTVEAGGKKSLLSSEEEALPRHLPPLGPRLPQPVLGFSLLSAPGRASWFSSRRRPGRDSASPVPGSAPPLSPPPPPPRSRPPRPQSPAVSGPAHAAALLGPRARPPDTRAGLPTRPLDTRARRVHAPPGRARTESTSPWTRARARIPRRTWTRALAPRAPPPPPPRPAPPRPRRALPDLEPRVGAAAVLGDWREPGPPGGRRPHHGLSPAAPRDSVPPGSAAAPVRHARRHTRARTRADTHVRSAPSPDGGARFSVSPAPRASCPAPAAGTVAAG